MKLTYPSLWPRHALTGAFAAMALLVGTCNVAVAAGPTIFFSLERDTPSLSPACQARLKGTEAEYKVWEQKLGRDIFFHYHHYCFALNFMNRTPLATLKKDKRYNLGRAIGNFDYVLRHWPPKAPLRPLAESGKRQAELMIKLL